MEKKKSYKSYVYERDGKLCIYCGKALKYRQISLDHYYPKSKGGPDDIFNIALSCRSCNKLKKNSLPKDWKERTVNCFKLAVSDEKILIGPIGIKSREVKELVDRVDLIERIGEISVFQSRDHSFYVRKNKIIKIVCIKR